MNLLYTLSGRAGSKGVKNKNIRFFNGCPLVYYTVAALALLSEGLAGGTEYRAVLNTDSEDLIALIERQKILQMNIVRRRAELAGDQVPKIKVTRDSLCRMEDRYAMHFDYVLDLDITSPLRAVKDIQNVLAIAAARPEADVVFSVTESRRSPYFNMVAEVDGYYRPPFASEGISTRQQTPPTYDMNASIYLYKRDFLICEANDDEFKGRCLISRMEDYGVLDIDSEQDFELLQIIAAFETRRRPDLEAIRARILAADVDGRTRAEGKG